MVRPDQRAGADAGLVEKAVNGMNMRRLGQAARRMLDTVNRVLADQHEADTLKNEEKRAEHETAMSLWDNGDGTFSGKFTIPELHGQLLRAALERLTSPRRLSRNKAGDLVQDDTVMGGCEGLNVYEKRGAGFTELLEHLPTEGFGAVAATLLVKINLEHLYNDSPWRGSTRACTSPPERLAAWLVGRGLVPMVLGGRSEVLDQGRASRLHTEVQRRALALTYDSCAAEGCECPYAWETSIIPMPGAAAGRPIS